MMLRTLCNASHLHTKKHERGAEGAWTGAQASAVKPKQNAGKLGKRREAFVKSTMRPKNASYLKKRRKAIEINDILALDNYLIWTGREKNECRGTGNCEKRYHLWASKKKRKSILSAQLALNAKKGTNGEARSFISHPTKRPK